MNKLLEIMVDPAWAVNLTGYFAVLFVLFMWLEFRIVPSLIKHVNPLKNAFKTTQAKREDEAQRLVRDEFYRDTIIIEFARLRSNTNFCFVASFAVFAVISSVSPEFTSPNLRIFLNILWVIITLSALFYFRSAQKRFRGIRLAKRLVKSAW